MYELMKKHSAFTLGILFVALVYFLSRPMGTLDSYWVVPTSLSILGDFNMDLDEYKAYGLVDSYSAIQINGHYFNFFPYGMSFLVIPFVGISKLAVDDSFIFHYHRHFEKLYASALVILSLFFLYKLFCYYLSKKQSAFLMVVMGLCTPLFTTGSRALWQHSGSVLILSLSLFILLYSIKKKPRFIPLLGFLLCFSYMIRPTNIIPFALLSCFVWFKFPNQRWKFVISIIFTMSLFVFLNILIFNDILPPYYRSNRLSFDWELFKTAFIGNIFSPNRGLIIWSPFLLFSILIIFVLNKDRSLFVLTQLIIFLHIIAISTFPHWWGGHSVGPRFMTDVMPFFAIIICVVYKRYSSNNLFLGFFLLLVTVSLIVQSSAVFSKNTQLWNIRGTDVNDTPERVWDWNRPQFYPFD